MNKYDLEELAYKNICKPIFFAMDPEYIHNRTTHFGEILEKYSTTKRLVSALFSYQNPILTQTIDGITFENPVGLSAGFDYDGNNAELMKYVGFGFNTVGTVTAKRYDGNTPPRLKRLPKSKSLLVNKGFKSDGADKVNLHLQSKQLQDNNIGISVGSSNLPEINTITKAIDDYVYTFGIFHDAPYVKYFELNISCPNTDMAESFANPQNLEDLLRAIKGLNISIPIFLKMANEISTDDADTQMKIAVNYGISGFIFSNLVKNRSNKYLDKVEVEKYKNLKGNFSGKPAYENSNKLIANAYKKHGKETTIIGTGGIFTAQDAYTKIKLGATLVQLITGMIYNGPQTAGKINYQLAQLLKHDGYRNISEAIGKGV